MAAIMNICKSLCSWPRNDINIKPLTSILLVNLWLRLVCSHVIEIHIHYKHAYTT